MIELGMEVEDTVSGFKGTATAHLRYLNGCVRIEITGKAQKDGKVPSLWVDEHQVETTGKQVRKPRPPSGGYEPDPPSRDPGA